MKKYICLVLLCYLGFNTNVFADDASDKEILDETNAMSKKLANTRAKLNTTIDINSNSKDEDTSDLEKEDMEFLEKLEKCEKFKGESKSTLASSSTSTKEILGSSDNKCEYRETMTDGKTLTCKFPNDKLKEISGYYKKHLSNGFGGKYNIDFDMKMPEIDFKKLSEDGFNFSLNMEMPKIKVDKVKTDIEKVIEDSCK